MRLDTLIRLRVIRSLHALSALRTVGIACSLTLVLSAGCTRISLRRLPPAPPTAIAIQREEVPDGRWLLVDTKREVLAVMDGSNVVKEFSNIAFGSAGAGEKKRRGDRVTPTGRFTLGHINKGSKFRQFILINYPNLDYAARALQNGVINHKTFETVRTAIEAGKSPPQDTLLGGMIGIHGVGRGDVHTHRLLNWTDGCIAVDNQQIDELVKFVHSGMVLIIR